MRIHAEPWHWYYVPDWDLAWRRWSCCDEWDNSTWLYIYHCYTTLLDWGISLVKTRSRAVVDEPMYPPTTSENSVALLQLAMYPSSLVITVMKHALQRTSSMIIAPSVALLQLAMYPYGNLYAYAWSELTTSDVWRFCRVAIFYSRSYDRLRSHVRGNFTAVYKLLLQEKTFMSRMKVEILRNLIFEQDSANTKRNTAHAVKTLREFCIATDHADTARIVATVRSRRF